MPLITGPSDCSSGFAQRLYSYLTGDSAVGMATGTAAAKAFAYEVAKAIADEVVADTALPTGTLAPFAGSTAPTGFLLCQGQAVSRTTYAALFAAIGTTYGAGDGSTTFNLPDGRGRALIGAVREQLNHLDAFVRRRSWPWWRRGARSVASDDRERERIDVRRAERRHASDRASHRPGGAVQDHGPREPEGPRVNACH